MITNIIDCQSCVEQKTVLQALNVVNQIFTCNSKLQTNAPQWNTALVLKIFEERLSCRKPTHKSFFTCNPYARDYVDRYFKNIKTIWMNYRKLREHELYFKMFFYSESRWIKMELIHLLFPNIETVNITNIEFSGTTLR
eukprot:264884_1